MNQSRVLLPALVVLGLAAILLMLVTTGGYISIDVRRSEERDIVSTDIVGTDIILIPSYDKLKAMSRWDRISLMHSYTNTYQILCRNQLRVGTVFDGGKEVCIDEPIAPKNSCLVYSFGSMNQFDFEEAVLHWFGCETHTFDPSMRNLAWKKMIKNPSGCTFHLTGLGKDNTVINKNWEIKTLATTMADLHHENKTLDILKIDVEGSEWGAIRQMIDSGAMSKVKQLQIELHFHSELLLDQLDELRRLYDAGFRMFNRERNIFCVHCNVFEKEINRWVPYNVEISFLNTRFL